MVSSSCARVCSYGFFLGIYFASFCCIVLTGCPKYFRPLTVLIPNYKYRCDIIHPLVRYHGRAVRAVRWSGYPNTRAACDPQPSNIWAYMPFGGAHTFLRRRGEGGGNALRFICPLCSSLLSDYVNFCLIVFTFVIVCLFLFLHEFCALHELL